MIRTLHASTLEVDDKDGALEDILGQIDESELLAHSVGIIGCNLDFITNGTIEALGERLPFDIIGGTTILTDISGDADEYQLALMILTSDDVSFACAASQPLQTDSEGKLTATYESAASKLDGEPTMGIFFAPYLLETSADVQLRALDAASGQLPLFGTVALDYVERVRDPRTIFNGQDHSDCLSLLLMSGDVDPVFFSVAIPESHFLKQKAVITSSEANVLKEVNNMPALEYMETLGLVKNGMVDGIPSIPLSIDTGDGGRPVARAIFAATPEGYIICGGDMPERAALGVGSLDAVDVQDTAEHLANQIAQSGKAGGALVFSCLSRNMALGLENMLEIERVQKALGDSLPYLLVYSAGELFPEIVDGKTFNKAHNFTMIACVF